MTSLQTERLVLVPATKEIVEAHLAGDRAVLERLLGAALAPTWPPPLLDDGALRWFMGLLADPSNDGWLLHFVVAKAASPMVIGTCGFKGKPSDGTVEIGYSIVPEAQRRGYATEAARALTTFAFTRPGVSRVIAETYPEMKGSIRVMENCGLSFAGPGSEPGTVRYARTAP
jgi:ribosomal-protein-alanine N-acetyltransferase